MSDWRELMRQGKFAEAEALMLTETDVNDDRYGDNTVARAEFYEAWGDQTRPPLEAPITTTRRIFISRSSLHGRQAAEKGPGGCGMWTEFVTRSEQ